MTHIPLSLKQLEERYKFRKDILDLFYSTLEERDIRRGVLDDMKNSPNPDKTAIDEYKDIIKKLDKELKRWNKLLDYVMKSDIKGEYPFRKNEGGRKKGQTKYFLKRDQKIIKMAHNLGYYDLNLPKGAVKDLLNKIADEFPELDGGESVRSVLKKI